MKRKTREPWPDPAQRLPSLDELERLSHAEPADVKPLPRQLNLFDVEPTIATPSQAGDGR
jgi:hypothetical protein